MKFLFAKNVVVNRMKSLPFEQLAKSSLLENSARSFWLDAASDQISTLLRLVLVICADCFVESRSLLFCCCCLRCDDLLTFIERCVVVVVINVARIAFSEDDVESITVFCSSVKRNWERKLIFCFYSIEKVNFVSSFN